jgi:NADH-quinone oxidoreductase subunit G
LATLTIDGRQVSVPTGTSVLEAARGIGIDIPNLCYDKSLSVAGACRMCVVEIEGFRNLPPACATPVSDGMMVRTETEQIAGLRRLVLDLLLSDHPQDCLTCDKAGNCRLQDYCFRYGIKESSIKGKRRNIKVDDTNHLIERNGDKCILCGKCVRVCREIQVTSAIDFEGRGFDSKIVTAYDQPLSMDVCRFCGQCVDMCPTGALINKQFKGVRSWEVRKVRTTCPLCGTGCNFDLNVKEGRVVGVTSNPEAPVNGTAMCVKGRFHTDFINSPDRITTPLIKRDGVFTKATWDEALDLVASNLKEVINQNGADAVAALSSARCTNEENWVMQKFMRAVVGTNNVDHCART